MKKPELLAPAGDLNRCKTAILYGADAVYLGGQSFSLRSRASNFTIDEIKEACDFAKAHNARIHVTVNIIPHDEDYVGLKEYVQKLEEIGVTAVIVASVGIMKIVKECTTKLEVHCSTQMSITNAETAMFLKNALNIDRVVLARECSIKDVREITEKCPVETEAFIHGGMCVNYSGRCTLSNRMTLRDANRGGCAQSCRWSYHLYDENKEYTENELFTMGSKDLCALPVIYDLMEAGVSSFKIEGRMKTEYYVASTVSSYRHLIDEIYENQKPLSEERMQYHLDEIMKAENRQTCTGFYEGRAGVNSIIHHETSDVDVNHGFLGRIQSFDANTSVAVIQSRNPFAVGDKIEVLSPGKKNRDFVITKLKNDKNEVIEECRNPMSMIQIEVPFEIKKGDIFRRY